MQKRWNYRITILLTLFGLASWWLVMPAFGASLVFGEAQGSTAETFVPVFLQLDQDTRVAGVQFQLHYPAGGATLLYVEPGAQSIAAQKNVNVHIGPSQSDVLVAGLNLNAIQPGEVARIYLAIRPEANLSVELLLSNVVMADPYGNPIPTHSSDAVLLFEPSVLETEAAETEEKSQQEESTSEAESTPANKEVHKKGGEKKTSEVKQASESENTHPERSTLASHKNVGVVSQLHQQGDTVSPTTMRTATERTKKAVAIQKKNARSTSMPSAQAAHKGMEADRQSQTVLQQRVIKKRPLRDKIAAVSFPQGQESGVERQLLRGTSAAMQETGEKGIFHRLDFGRHHLGSLATAVVLLLLGLTVWFRKSRTLR